jgi:hypothetical protein
MKRKTLFTQKAARAAVLFLTACLIGSLGCRSTDQGTPASLASVVISGNTPGQIRDAAIEVFRENGYQVARTDPASLVFEKQGSGMSNFAYGNWLGDSRIWIRVKTAIRPAGEMSFRLQCNAYMVRDRGAATEEEIALSKVHRGKYKKLLEEVAKRFTQKWPVAMREEAR